MSFPFLITNSSTIHFLKLKKKTFIQMYIRLGFQFQRGVPLSHYMSKFETEITYFSTQLDIINDIY